MSEDAEVAAMEAIAIEMSHLDAEARCRVAEWVAARWAIRIEAAPIPSPTDPRNVQIVPLSNRMPGCGCEVGTACLNAACPHRLIVTCQHQTAN